MTSAYGRSYGYDSAGRLTSYEGTSYTAFAAGHPHAVVDVGGATRYTYDANGNMTTRWSTQFNGWQTLTWDHENRLNSVTGAGTDESYLYDGDGQRVRKVGGGVTTAYVNLFYELSGTTVTKYYYFNGQRVAVRQGNNPLYYLYSDHLGSTGFVTHDGGTPLTNQRYYAFGKVRLTGALPTDHWFTGQKYSSGNGLYHYGARYYDPELGRFIQPDTIVSNPGDAQSFDRYTYALNNPLRYIDPTGHWSEDQLNEVLGQNWQSRYFGDLAPYKGAFAGNDKLLQFLTSSETTNMFDLRMAGVAMGVDEFVSTLVGNTPDAIAIRGNFGAGAIIGVGNSFEAVVNFRSSELSYFWSPGASGGAIGGAGGDIGISIINDLPSNTAYRGYFGAVKADFKYGTGGTVEGFLGLPLPNFPDGDIFAGANGAFLGVGLGGKLDLSAGFSYAFEALRATQMVGIGGRIGVIIIRSLMQAKFSIRHIGGLVS